VERLRDALQGEGLKDEAARFTELLSGPARVAELAPSRIVRSAAALQAGEQLTRNTPLPVDRETGTALAEIIFPDHEVESPVLGEELSAAVQSIQDEWKHADMLESAGVAALRSLLIYGAPGTGKTQLALAMAAELELPAVVARLDGLVSSFLGTTSRNIGALFQFAARYRCVLLLDEFDAIGKLRDDPHEMGEIKRVVNTLLQNLDGRSRLGFTIGITNHEQLLDPAVWRRFEAQLAIPRPAFGARLAIVRRYMGPLGSPERADRLLAWATEGASGADIEQICRSLRKRLLVGASQANEQPLLEALRSFLPVHAGRLERSRVELLGRPIEEVIPALVADTTLGLSRADLAQLAGRDPATIGRWVQRASSNGTRN
jgi:SpoVK/Ycf46/Vps4 family AAA+-type ATPase